MHTITQILPNWVLFLWLEINIKFKLRVLKKIQPAIIDIDV